MRRPIDSAWSPVEVLRALRSEPHPFCLSGSWLDSSAILGSEPVAVIDQSRLGQGDPFSALDAPPVRDASQGGDGVFGGWVGYLGYQAGRLVERLPAPPLRPLPLPEWWLGWYDNVLRFEPSGGWCFEALVTPERSDAIEARHNHLETLLSGEPPGAKPYSTTTFDATPGAEDHRKAIRQTLEHILAGDIYQANICLRLEAGLEGSALDLFAAGVEALAPPKAAFLDLGQGRAVASLSPEQFLRRRGREVVTAPIKGTRRRTGGSGDERSDPGAVELASSAKDRAENVMIVDLMRNDLGRVCSPGSITVPRLFGLEPHPGVWHLVSEVRGTLADGVGDAALLRATFPPGSVTGAPKIRAMEVISEVEVTAREVYTGSIGITSPAAGADWNVAIRTFEAASDQVWLGVGGGIIAESVPDSEVDECIAKAAPLLRAVGATLAPL